MAIVQLEGLVQLNPMNSAEIELATFRLVVQRLSRYGRGTSIILVTDVTQSRKFSYK
jgi:hypothetical protein